jgi:hypothetical protein
MSRRALRDERGVATVIVVLSIPLLILFCVFAVDVANWYVHKRHLQTQADAAALAGAGLYTFPACDDNLIINTAKRYSGKGDAVATYNAPDGPEGVGTPQSRLFAEINKPNYKDQTEPNEADLAGSPSPCTAKFVDVKMTEKDVPLIFSTAFLPVAHINAQARVKLFQVDGGKGLLPLGVQEAAPRKVRAYVVDEATGTPIPGASAVLATAGSSGGLVRFNNDAAPVTFDVPAGTSRLGVRLALSGTDTSTTCGDQLVNCYDSASANGLSFIHTWSDAPLTNPATDAPVARSVYLQPGTCGNGSFNSMTAPCTIDVRAKVDWNTTVTTADLDPVTSKTKLTLNFNGSSYAMTYVPATSTWGASLPVPAGTITPRDISLDWEQQHGTVGTDACGTTGGNKCKGSFGTVQRTFWNDPLNQGSRAGPVASLDVLDSSTLQQVSDLQRCSTTHPTCTARLVFEVGIKGALGLDAATDPPRSMRVAGSSSQNQSLDCDPARSFIDEIAYGCQPPYGINKGTPCSSPTSPPSCVPVSTGTQANKPAQGFNIRFLCEPPGNPGNCKGSPGNWDGKPSTCPPAGQFGHNNWPNYPKDDPREVDIFLVPFGTFEANGSQLVPIIDVGAFYVTGYASNGAGFANPCIGNGDQFVPGTEGDNGVISGHFVKKVTPNTGPVGDETCDFNDIGQCAAVLVK